MTISTHARDLMKQASALLPDSDEDLIYKGIATSISERIMSLKQAGARLRQKYGTFEELERRIQSEGVSPDDHTLYTDLLEWRAINYERSQLLQLLEAI